MPIKPIPDVDDLARHCPKSSVERDDAGTPIGVSAKAFLARVIDGALEEGLSHQWFQELSAQAALRLSACQDAMESDRTMHRDDAIGLVNAGAIRALEYSLHVIHDEQPQTPAHAEIRGYSLNNFEDVADVLALLARPLALPKAPKKRPK